MWITFLQQNVSEFAKVNELKIYLFGSALHSVKPNDLDIVIVYQKKKLSFESIIQLKYKLIEIIENKINLPIDVCLLSDEEVLSNPFLEDENAKLIINF